MKTTRHLVKKKASHVKRAPAIKEISLEDAGIELDISEEYRDSALELGDPRSNTSVNLSEAQDRSEDLINEVDPFTQEPEKVKKVLRISERPL